MPQTDVPDWEDLDCEPRKKEEVSLLPGRFLSCFLLLRSWPVEERKSAWTTWFCLFL